MNLGHSQFTQKDVNQVTELKKKLAAMKSHQKVQIQNNKKLDKMFWLLIEQNAEVSKQISNYRQKYAEQTACVEEFKGIFLENGNVDEKRITMSAIKCKKSECRSPQVSQSGSGIKFVLGGPAHQPSMTYTRQSLSGLRQSAAGAALNQTIQSNSLSSNGNV